MKGGSWTPKILYAKNRPVRVLSCVYIYATLHEKEERKDKSTGRGVKLEAEPWAKRMEPKPQRIIPRP